MSRRTNEEIIGKKFGRLTVCSRGENTKTGKTRWWCKCDCGNPAMVLVVASDLKSGNTKSCGCIQKETRSINGKSNTTHGESTERLYKIWIGMKKRCYNIHAKDYPNYGGRGIKICEEWLHSYENFRDWSLKNGYESHLTIDRKQVNGDYSPDNCQWSTVAEQNRNKRTTKNNKY